MMDYAMVIVGCISVAILLIVRVPDGSSERHKRGRRE